MKSVAALLSGGVDSAVALARFIENNPEQKAHITAYYLKIWLEDELSFLGNCPWEEDLQFAKKVCSQLDIKLEVISLQHEYYEKVVNYTVNELKQGGTPSPDIFCNQLIKFGVFFDKIRETDITISGHYARLEHDKDSRSTRLLRSSDVIKDQTYFLSHLSQAQLNGLLFPIGDMQKFEVRKYASNNNLAPHQRKDSQGICFLGKIKYSDFVKYHLGIREGKIIDVNNGKILGAHEGSWFYTIGQRSGVGLGGGPWYVARKSFDENIVWVRHGDMLTANEVNKIYVSNIHWISEPKGAKVDSFKSTTLLNIVIDNLSVKLRHGPDMISATLTYNPQTLTGTVHLERGDTGVAEGQFTVLYLDEECLGCARISSVDENRTSHSGNYL